MPRPSPPQTGSPQGDLDLPSPLLPLDGSVGGLTRGEKALSTESRGPALPRQEKGDWASAVSSSQECSALWEDKGPLRPLTLTGGPSALQPALLGHRGRFQANLEADLEELHPHVPDAVLMQGLPQKCSETSGAYPFCLPHHTRTLFTSCEEPLPGGAPPEGLAVKPGGAALTEACHMAERRGSPCLQPTTRRGSAMLTLVALRLA